MAVFTKNFSSIIKIEDNFEKNLIMDSQVQNLNIYSKIVSDVGIYIYGYYDIYLLYKRNGCRGEENSYRGRFISKNLCVVIPELDILGNKANTNTIGNITRLSLKPSSRIIVEEEKRHRDIISIEVYGEIKFQYSIKKLIRFNETKTVEGQEILQFENSSKYSIKELMDMDVEELKKIYGLKK
ncbi:hypothetical protein BJV85_001438 [Clostridium acetobutylicum]|uniref:Uncharacterized protein n=1 Tax=Clostridium acetobutylicum (strain ATCC 824 / DSM 792 / JCM 1419 / IAM 19013 / LMG 5710 / NBRC 13948 / NRRL B-527 / VKM B-1787 / 2291 / W) TaxID=272562 RepID=Q97GC1_CLOAB|nr:MULTISPECIES: hypothetical protein [Clostridium]AAK80401.1 Hypothetical protein CA_C2447 [Clostridium acetobutylicum ATCC 824]ADZ21498.1 Conserved hypothetical protein [Clostridium acetobutylicum EA 2018]AEI32346.1 hypothetical protein SMB_G2482 [Clostridium acetobutylicum DSM 1731]AWV79181.1 hypothetical protein DK921_03510 [Clostridium acetobutylicum]MBC2394855.1 hypothetical protein [Clostridium acetobutylicum]